MWARLKSVAMTYLTRKLFWLFALIYSLALPGMYLGMTKNSDASTLAAGFQALFFGAYLCFILGVHLKQQFANPRASLLPNFGTPHLVVSIGLMLVVTLITTMCASLHSATHWLGALAVAVHVNFMAHRLGSNPTNASAWIFVVSVAGMTTPMGRELVFEIITGREPTLVLALLVGHVCGLLLQLDDMLKLDEDSPGYQIVVNFNAWDMRAPAQRALIRNMSQRDSGYLRLMGWATRKRLERATAGPATTPAQRIALFGLGDNWPSPLLFNQVAVAAIAIFFLWLIGGRNSIRTAHELSLLMRIFLVAIMAFVWGVWFMWGQRWSRLGYESLRPVSRQEWVWENGVSIGKTVALNHCIAALLQVVIVGVVLPEFLQDSSLWLVLMFATGVQVLAFGVFAYVSSFGSMLAMGAVMGTLSTLMMTPGAFMPGDNGLNVGLMFLLTGIAIAIGTGLSGLAFRRWCRMDLP